jgi:ribosomal protein S18 acetylase RimI-like enzyme
MKVTSRYATADDIDVITEYYRDLEQEQSELRPLWKYADGVDTPVAVALESLLDDDDSVLLVGEIDDYPFGFLWMRSEPLLVQAEGERVGVVRLIHVDQEARGVGVGDAMVTMALDEMRRRGHRLFDARVSPGHRNAKNFFESNGFSARLIVMHRNDATADD